MNPNKYNKSSHSGRFNKRISLHGPIVTSDGIGNQINNFGELEKLWSMIKTIKGNEYVSAAQTQSINVTRFVVRYSDKLRDLFEEHKTKLEIRYRKVTYNIKSVINDDEANQTFTIVAEGKL